MNSPAPAEKVFDLALTTVRELNQSLHRREKPAGRPRHRLRDPGSR